MEESKVRFEYKPTFTAQSRRKQERRNEGHDGQEAFGNVDAGDLRLRWYTVSELGAFFANYAEMRCKGVNREYWNPIRPSIHPRA